MCKDCEKLMSYLVAQRIVNRFDLERQMGIILGSHDIKMMKQEIKPEHFKEHKNK